MSASCKTRKSSSKRPKKSKQKASLATFAKEHGCFLCSIPERQEVESARQAGVESRMILRWLIESCGYAEERVAAARTGMPGHFTYHSKVVLGARRK